MKHLKRYNESSDNKKIPTAEELFKDYSNLLQFEEGPPEYLVDKEDFISALHEFAKAHVEAALERAAENAEITYFGNYIVDKHSILTAYPLENIK